MSTSEKILEHLEPVAFTFVACTVLLLLSYVVQPIEQRLRQFDIVDRFIRQLDEYSRVVSRRIDLIERQLYHWWNSRAIMSTTSDPRSTCSYDPDRSSFLETPIKPLTTFDIPMNSQDESVLFSLPAEILDMIVAYVLTPEQDLSNLYPFSTCYRRPGHLAPTKTSTSLLQTCQQIYSTHWYLPWTLSSHTFYLAWSNRSPPTTTSIETMMRTSYLIENLHPDAPPRRKRIQHIQVFAQLCNFENGYQLNRILSIPHFNPRAVTITVRHTDWWSWENDNGLQFYRTSFLSELRFPPSVEIVNFEFESLERKRAQVDWMAKYASQNWHFLRKDDVHLAAAALYEPPVPVVPSKSKDTLMNTKTNSDAKAAIGGEVIRWKGSATWEDQRWIRDEDDREPNVLSYYVVSVPFRAVKLADDPEGYERRYIERERMLGSGLAVEPSVVEATTIIWDWNNEPSLMCDDLERAGILGPYDESGAERTELQQVSASEALSRVNEMLAQEEEAVTGINAMSQQEEEEEEVGDEMLEDDDAGDVA